MNVLNKGHFIGTRLSHRLHIYRKCLMSQLCFWHKVLINCNAETPEVATSVAHPDFFTEFNDGFMKLSRAYFLPCRECFYRTHKNTTGLQRTRQIYVLHVRMNFWTDRNTCCVLIIAYFVLLSSYAFNNCNRIMKDSKLWCNVYPE